MIDTSKKEGKGSRWIFLQLGAVEEAMFGLVLGCCCWQGQIADQSCCVYLKFLTTSSLPWSPSVQDLWSCQVGPHFGTESPPMMALFSFLQTEGSSKTARPHLLPPSSRSPEKVRIFSHKSTHTSKTFAIKLPPFGKKLYTMHNLKGSGAGSSYLFTFCWNWGFFFPSLHCTGNCQWLYIFIESEETFVKLK